MSLVNDMLRDLDARRRSAPGRGPDTESLKPAEDARPTRRGITAGLLLGLALAVVLAAAAAFGAYWYAGGEQSPGPLRDLPVASSGQPAGGGQPTSDGGDGSSGPRVEQLNRQLQTLEAENRRLERQAGQGGDSAQSANGSTSQSSGTQAGSVASGDDATEEGAENDTASLLAEAAGQQEQAWQPRDWSTAGADDGNSDAAAQRMTAADSALAQNSSDGGGNGGSGDSGAPAQSGAGSDGVGRQAQQSTAEDGSDLVRTPRQLSFRERDRRQARQALQMWNDERQNAALRALDEFTTTNPEAHQSRELLAKLLLERGQTSQARTIAEMGLNIAPNHRGYRKVMARLMLGEEQAGQAVALLAERPPSVSRDPEYHELLASAALSNGDWEQAMEAYRGLLSYNGEQGRWWYGLAAALDAMNRGGDAAGAYQRALQDDRLSASLRRASRQRLEELN